MGFVVNSDGLVSVAHDNKSHGDTRVSSNPTSSVTHCNHHPLVVYSIFIRHKNRTNKRDTGDNCPLIYALKKKESLRVSYNSFKSLVPNLNAIIEKFVLEQDAQGIYYDVVIPMPSSHSISYILAKRLAHKLGARLATDAFRKTTSQDLNLQLLQDNFTGRMIPHGARTSIMNAVSKANENNQAFSLSDVLTEYREYVQPVVYVNIENISPKFNVLLVDDLFASGQTLISAKEQLYANVGNVEAVDAVCLFSPLNGRIRKRS